MGFSFNIDTSKWLHKIKIKHTSLCLSVSHAQILGLEGINFKITSIRRCVGCFCHLPLEKRVQEPSSPINRPRDLVAREQQQESTRLDVRLEKGRCAERGGAAVSHAAAVGTRLLLVVPHLLLTTHRVFQEACPGSSFCSDAKRSVDRPQHSFSAQSPAETQPEDKKPGMQTGGDPQPAN